MSLRQAIRTAMRSHSATKRIPRYATLALRPLFHTERMRIPSFIECTRRSFATPPSQVKHSEFPVHQYHQLSDATMDRMLESLENILDEMADPEYEVEYGSGVLTLKLGSKGTYVINKQPPNKQIWLSSPFSGPKRYDYVPELDDWMYSRDARSLNDLLNQELSDALGRKVDLGLTNISTQVG